MKLLPKAVKLRFGTLTILLSLVISGCGNNEKHLEDADSDKYTMQRDSNRQSNIELMKLEEDLARNPDNKLVHIAYANMLAENNLYEKAAKNYAVLYNHEGSRNAFALDYAEVLLKIYQIEKAHKIYADYYKQNPGDLQGVVKYSMFLAGYRIDTQKAEQLLADAIKKFPDSEYLNLSMATLLSTYLRRPDEALKIVEAMMTKAPESEYPLQTYILINTASKKNYEVIAKEAPDFIKKYGKKAGFVSSMYASYLMWVKKDSLAAIEQLAYALKLNPVSAFLNAKMGYFLSYMPGQQDKVMQYFEKAQQYETQAYSVGKYMGDYYCELKQYEKAEKYFAMEFEQNPTGSNNNCSYAKCLILQGKIEQADKQLGYALKSGLLKFDTEYYIWWLRYAFYPEWRMEAEQKMSELIDMPLCKPSLKIGPLLELAIEQGHPDIDKLREYARRITEK